jgi:hypothetical protein
VLNPSRSTNQLRTRGTFNERYLQELRDLVDERKITRAFAQRVTADLFEAGQAGQLSLKWWVWCSYIEDVNSWP